MIQNTQLPESWFKVKLFVDTLSDILLSESETKASQLKILFHAKVSGDITFCKILRHYQNCTLYTKHFGGDLITFCWFLELISGRTKILSCSHGRQSDRPFRYISPLFQYLSAKLYLCFLVWQCWKISPSWYNSTLSLSISFGFQAEAGLVQDNRSSELDKAALKLTWE